MNSLIECKNITKEFTKKRGEVFIAIQALSLEIDEGRLVAISGPSGSGKSTLLSIMAGLDRPTSGDVFFEGEKMTGWSEKQCSSWRRENIGFVFQTWELIPTLTAFENICLPLLPSRRSRTALRRSASLLLRRVGLSDKAHDFPPRLSGGEQQRVALARALVSNPRVVFADEPTGNIDKETGSLILELLREQTHNDTTVVLVTHDEKIASCADKVFHILGGHLVPGDTKGSRP